MLRRLFRLCCAMTRMERWILLAFSLLFLVSTFGLLTDFYYANTVLVATTGGTYIEGSVGELQPLNPWFTVQNDVNRDIVSLVFSSLLKYNPQMKKIEGDLATMEVSGDSRLYTLKLKEDLFWHDSTPESPHPVTADDVLFTFKTIQDPAFPNTLLQQNFRGVSMEKLDDRTVRFELSEPYNFFPSNLTFGLLPKKSFEGVPVSKLDQALDFGFQPVGAGPYRVRAVVQTDLSTEVTLEQFPRTIPPQYHLERLVFRIYPDYATLLSDIRTLQGVRLVTRNKNGEPVIPKRFHYRSYTLPQYAGFFFNLERKALQDEKLRLGLQLGTNKQAIADALHEPVIVDTPLLEVDMSDWRYKFDAKAAQGALFASRWNLPEKVRLQHLLEQEDANKTGILRLRPVVELASGSILTFSGSLHDVPPGSSVNGVKVLVNPAHSGSWLVSLPASAGTGVVKVGENLLRITDPNGRIIDSFYLRRVKDSEELARALEERRLLELFLQTRAGAAPPVSRVEQQDFFLENGYLRRRRPEDPVSIRKNERGEPLEIVLLTSHTPAEYRKTAELIKEQWRPLGVDVRIEIPPSRADFQDRLLRRNYDIVLFGQSLLDNLDSYAYWHSSGVQRLTGDQKDLRSDAYNLSQYSSFQADTLLEKLRRTGDEKDRMETLRALQETLKKDIPAIFFYSPLYTFAFRQDVQGVELGSLSLHSDRFLTLHRWYIEQERVFEPGKSWWSFFHWLLTLRG